VVMIPLYLLMVQIGLRNTLWALIIPQAATAFGIFLLRQSFLGVPVELEEAARSDGCTPLGEWWNVMIPAARADLITLATDHPGDVRVHRHLERLPLAAGDPR